MPGTRAGGPVRSVYSMLNLLKNDFDFYVITTNQDLGSTKPYENIVADKLLEQEGVRYYYFSKAQLKSNNFVQLISNIKPDLIYLNSFWSFFFSINVVRLKNRGLIKSPVLLAPRGMLGKGALSLKSFKKESFISLVKLSGSYRNINFHATQAQEKLDVLNKFKNATVLVAPNVNSTIPFENKSIKKPNHLSLFYLSRVAKVKNLHYALELLASIPSAYTIQYDIYGSMEESDYWSLCKSLIAKLPPHVKVDYKGELTFHAVQQTICQYNCLLLPTLNENFGHAIVEALLCGCPAIISDQTPWNDLEEANAGFAISLNQKQKFIEATVYFAAMDENKFSLSSKKAINYISNKIDLAHIALQYKQLFNDAIKN